MLRANYAPMLSDQVSSDLGPLPQEGSPGRRAFAEALALAHKILADRDRHRRWRSSREYPRRGRPAR